MNPHDTLGPALDALAADLAGDRVVPPDASDAWQSGARRRWRLRGLATTVAVLAVAAVVGTIALPGVRPESMPASRPGEPLPSYPARVAMPWRVADTAAPGRSALAMVRPDAPDPVVHVVGPTGAVTTLRTGAEPMEQGLSLSPDGRVLALGTVVHDLETGQERDLAVGGVTGAGWWSPDSRRLYLPGPGGQGVVVGVDGDRVVVPPSGGGDGVVAAGWVDDATVLAVWQSGAGTFTLASWRLGRSDWTLGPSIDWPAWPQGHRLGASVSPDGTRIVLYGTSDVAGPDGPPPVVGQVFDVASGDVVGIPVGDTPAAAAEWDRESFLHWPGTGCRPAWRDGAPVTTDGAARSLDPAQDDLVVLSPAFGSPCLAVAGGGFHGEPSANTAAVWSERVRTGLPWLLLVLAGGLVLWRFARGRAWAGGHEQLPPMPPPYGR
ncbi:hypothetical protein [uncultured Phycicoccus sp.]|uniref:hypothetical protein n=1 Tax=uncultured Phycicoccus sp. TaxID=661422 RepID=UPI00262DF25A|nr:hypothetical protein [uncultured Phycicoccus sp.]